MTRFLPASVVSLALRFALAVPFFFSGLTKWDGFGQLSGGALYLFGTEFRLHIFGAEIPYPFPVDSSVNTEKFDAFARQVAQ